MDMWEPRLWEPTKKCWVCICQLLQLQRKAPALPQAVNMQCVPACSTPASYCMAECLMPCTSCRLQCTSLASVTAHRTCMVLLSMKSPFGLLMRQLILAARFPGSGMAKKCSWQYSSPDTNRVGRTMRQPAVFDNIPCCNLPASNRDSSGIHGLMLR